MELDLTNPALQAAIDNFKQSNFTAHIFRNMDKADYSGDLPLNDQLTTINARLRSFAWNVLTFYNGKILNAISTCSADDATKARLSEAHRQIVAACFASDQALLSTVEEIVSESVRAPGRPHIGSATLVVKTHD